LPRVGGKSSRLRQIAEQWLLVPKRRERAEGPEAKGAECGANWLEYCPA
jgi:hypothetical protein